MKFKGSDFFYFLFVVKHSVLLSVLLWVLLISCVTALLQNTPSAAHKGITEAAVGPFSPLVEYTEAVLLVFFFVLFFVRHG